MKKQTTKAFTAFALFAALALFAAVDTARAQSPVNIRINVPFDFYVGERLLAAGEYTVRRVGGSDMLVVAGAGERATRQTSAVGGGREGGATRLVFHRYGEQHFLARLWVAGDEQGREFLASRRERAIRAEGAQVAALGGNAEGMKPAVVEIAAGQ